MRKHYTAAFKAEIVRDVVKEEKTIAQIGAAQGVHATLISQWKAAALEELPSLFEKDHSAVEKERAAHENQVNDQCAEIGRLTFQVAWMSRAGLSAG